MAVKKEMLPEAKKFVVGRKWKSDTDSFSVDEYFSTIEECIAYVKSRKKSKLYDWYIGEY